MSSDSVCFQAWHRKWCDYWWISVFRDDAVKKSTFFLLKLTSEISYASCTTTVHVQMFLNLKSVTNSQTPFWLDSASPSSTLLLTIIGKWGFKMSSILSSRVIRTKPTPPCGSESDIVLLFRVRSKIRVKVKTLLWPGAEDNRATRLLKWNWGEHCTDDVIM